MLPLFDDNQKLDKSELLDSLTNKTPRIHKAMLISQDFIPGTGYLATFTEHYKQAETTNKISGQSLLPQTRQWHQEKKMCSKFKELDENWLET